MNNVMTHHTCSAGHAQDMVGLNFGSCHIQMYYQTGFEIAASTLQSSKLAARFEGVNPSKWIEMAKIVPQVPTEPFSPFFRRGEARPNFTNWSVGFERNLVVFKFDDTTIKLHYSDSFTYYGWVRLASRNAKRWAGDKGRQWTTRAHLQDAEDNDKFLYVK